MRCQHSFERWKVDGRASNFRTLEKPTNWRYKRLLKTGVYYYPVLSNKLPPKLSSLNQIEQFIICHGSHGSGIHTAHCKDSPIVSEAQTKDSKVGAGVTWGFIHRQLMLAVGWDLRWGSWTEYPQVTCPCGLGFFILGFVASIPREHTSPG